MTVSHGMNVEEVRALGQQLQTQSDNIQQVMSNLDHAVGNATWLGQDADTFKNQWWPQHRQQLQQVVQGLHDFGQSAKDNAQAQEDVSRS